ncbi:uncharacterized protein LOC131012321 [Salvia miltiorrhiza]|uniref:uncharacterized protein LOC131012321 n=1 Tax=Salvia miltiorrhiza TaxID=226208 RepID=UPI0025AD76A7|nr:uncharacterized protein LOC131012321 [Salvia miltiorrhiza]
MALYCLFEKTYKDDGLRVRFDVELFGHESKLYIMKKDLVPFCNMEPITGGCIVAYICHLYNNLREIGADSKFLFVNLFTVDNVVKQEDRTRTLSQRLLEVAASDVLVCVPCNVGGHWILTIIEVEKGKAFLMDPLSHRNKDSIWKSVVDTALSMVTAKNGKKMKKANWEVIKGPTQPDDKQCGYFVMRFMRDIIEGSQNTAASTFHLSSLFKGVTTYSQNQLNEVREEWARCLIKNALAG